MSPHPAFRRLFRLPWRSRSQIRAEVEEEIGFHLDMRIEELIRQGLPREEARRQAHREFGDLEEARASLHRSDEEVERTRHRAERLEGLRRDLLHALRLFRRSPALALGTILTLALGIGVTTTVFTVVNAVLLRPLPVEEPERLVGVQRVLKDGRTRGSFSLPDYLDYQAGSAGVLSGLAAHHLSDISLATAAGAEAALATSVSGNYFQVLGIRPFLGRFFDAAEADPRRAEAVAVVSHEVWRTRFAADPEVLGRTLRVSGEPLTVIGVAPEGFHGGMLGARPAVWIPLGLYARLHPERDVYGRASASWLQLVGRLREGATLDQAEAALSLTTRQLAAAHEYPFGEDPVGVRVRAYSPLPGQLRDAVPPLMGILLATAALVLLIATVNVAAMLLARSAARGREMAIRLAIGAGRSRLFQQVVTESALLALLGGVAGVALARLSRDWLAEVRVPLAAGFRLDLPLDARVLGFALAVSLLAGVAAGLAPALYAARGPLLPALQAAAPGSPRRARGRRLMVAGQLALSVLLLVTAGLFVRTLRAAWSTDFGFQPEGVLAVEIDLQLNGYDEERGRQFYDRLLERVRELPGVESAALSTVVPLGTGWDQTRVRVPGHEPPEGEPGFAVGVNVVTPGYFEALRLPVLAGRALAEADRDAAEPALVINETFARRFWPGRSPVGERVRFGRDDAVIVGVVPDGRYRDFAEEPPLYAYVPFGRAYSQFMWLQARVRGPAAPVVAGIRREMRALDPSVPPIAVTTVREVMGGSLFPQRVAAGLVGLFGAVGLLLAAVGVFGVLSFSVAQRTREIGVRMALGASRGRVLGLVLRDALGILAGGLAAGLVASLLLTRLLRGLLHGLSPSDPVTFLGVTLLLGVVALAAAALPARRAARVDPMVALRTD